MFSKTFFKFLSIAPILISSSCFSSQTFTNMSFTQDFGDGKCTSFTEIEYETVQEKKEQRSLLKLVAEHFDKVFNLDSDEADYSFWYKSYDEQKAIQNVAMLCDIVIREKINDILCRRLRKILETVFSNILPQKLSKSMLTFLPGEPGKYDSLGLSKDGHPFGTQVNTQIIYTILLRDVFENMIINLFSKQTIFGSIKQDKGQITENNLKEWITNYATTCYNKEVKYSISSDIPEDTVAVGCYLMQYKKILYYVPKIYQCINNLELCKLFNSCGNLIFRIVAGLHADKEKTLVSTIKPILKNKSVLKHKKDLQTKK